MSNEYLNFRPSFLRERANASSIVRPMTNWCPMIRIACLIAVRISGSPARLAIFPRYCAGVFVTVVSSCRTSPVNIKPHVEALTNSESLAPKWSFHRAEVTLSAISRSAVSASGMRSNASAMHISNTPSCDDKSYCCKKASIPPSRADCLRTARTRPAAVSPIVAHRFEPASAKSTNSRTSAASSARYR